MIRLIRLVKLIRLIRFIRLDLQWRGRLQSYMWMDRMGLGWMDGMVIIGHKSSKSTFNANIISIVNNLISCDIQQTYKAKNVYTENLNCSKSLVMRWLTVRNLFKLRF